MATSGYKGRKRLCGNKSEINPLLFDAKPFFEDLCQKYLFSLLNPGSAQNYKNRTFLLRGIIYCDLFKRPSLFQVDGLVTNASLTKLFSSMCGMIQISILQVALVFFWFIGVNSFPAIRDKKDYPKITLQNGKQNQLFNQLFSKRINDISVVLRSRRALTAVFPSVPTNTRRGILISKTYNMLAVYTNGTVKGINDANSPYVQMERQSFNTSILRIMAVEAGLYVAMERNGRIVTKKKRDNKSLWIENREDNQFLTYRSYYMSDEFNCTSKWFLAIKNNGRIKNGNNTLSGMNSAQFQFLNST